MKKLIFLISVTSALSAFFANASALPLRYSNEWSFEYDASGLPLSSAINTGTNSPAAHFDAGFGSTVFTTNRELICIGSVPGTDGTWTNGAILNAALPAAASGVHYLRYDVDYNLSSPTNNNGSVFGVYFSGSTGDQVAGLVLGSDIGNSLLGSAPTNRSITSIDSQLPLFGRLTAITEVNLDAQTIKVWYGVNGTNNFDLNNPAYSTNIVVSSIDGLRFQATGDFRPDGTANYVAVDNIRHAGSWSDMVDAIANVTAPPSLSISSISDSLDGGMERGQTNIVTVVIRNSGGTASNVTSSLSYTGTPNGLTVISNNAPASLYVNSSITNQYLLIAQTEGSYKVTVQAQSEQGAGGSNNLQVVVGSQVSYLSNKIEWVSGGVLSNYYEPGEILRITVVSTNNGARAVSNVVNTLSANPDYFTILPASAQYPNLAVGDSTSTVYAVSINASTPAGIYTFSVTNRTDRMEWTGSFTLEVFNKAIPGVSTNALTLRVPKGTRTVASLVLSNSGNADAGYVITDNGLRPTSGYMLTRQETNRVAFKDAQFYETPTALTNWVNGIANGGDIGFEAPVFGLACSTFSVNRQGSLIFTAGTNSVKLDMFAPSSEFPADSIRFLKGENRLVVAWGNGTDRECQAWIHADGTIQLLYQEGAWGQGTMTLSDSRALYQQFYYTPGEYTPGEVKFDGVLLTPLSSWVTYSPSSGSLSGGGAQTLSFVADTTGFPASAFVGTNTFKTYINWFDRTTNVVDVTVIVENVTTNMTMPGLFTFRGPAGFIAQTSLVVSNGSNVAQSYRITDVGMLSAGYVVSNAASSYSWQDADTVLSEAQIGSSSFNIGFPFLFFGNVYTALTVNVDGTLSLGGGRVISPLATSPQLYEKSKIKMKSDSLAGRFVVTWESFDIYTGVTNQEFQAVLDQSGIIRFNYKQLAIGWTNWAIQVVDPSQTVSGILSNAATTLVATQMVQNSSNIVIKTSLGQYQSQTNWTTTNLVVTYKPKVSLQSLEFIPGRKRIITASPMFGTIAAHSTTNILISGDARSLTLGGPNAVTNSTTFTFSYQLKTTNVVVNFIATNSASTAYSTELATGLAGTDYFAASVARNADGSRTISWPAATDGFIRTYKVWYTLSLMQKFQQLTDESGNPVVLNGTGYVDKTHADAPVIYYKVTVE